MRYFLIAVLFVLISAGISAESLTVINRTGSIIELIQAAPSGQDQWGDDLIPGQVILDGESISLDLNGFSPWAFRMIDSNRVVYVLYDVMPAVTGKLTVGPENLAGLALFAGAERDITFTNQTGETISSLRISAVTDSGWGSDILDGRYLREGESVKVSIDVIPGTLSFDIRFTLISGNQEIPYEKPDVILTDGASLILSSQSRN
ncbi:MAG: hypothetical protein KAH21_09575 [Spirochaetaceae bacterium]|nr:hypothetical protein [Spirochaetaceae bacterium]